MTQGLSAVLKKLSEYETAGKVTPLSAADEQIKDTLEVAAEMLDRGFTFKGIDLYKSEALDFVVDEENKTLYAPFIVVDGIGEKAANTVIKAREEGIFLSKEDIHDRTSLTEANINDLADLGVLDGLGESNQMSIFDF